MALPHQSETKLRLDIIERKLFLLWCDFIIVSCAIFLTIILRPAITMELFLSRGYLGIIILYSLLAIIIFYVVDLYNIFLIDFWISLLPRIFLGVTLTTLLIISSSFYLEFLALPRVSIVLFSLVLIGGMAGSRYYFMVVRRYATEIYVIGSGFTTLKIIEDLVKTGSACFKITGIYDEDPDNSGKKVMDFKVKGGVEAFIDDVHKNPPQIIVVSFDNRIPDQWSDALLRCARKGIQVISAVDFYGRLFSKVPTDYIDTLWLLSGMQFMRRPYSIIKRFLDIVFSILGLLILAILFPCIYAGIKITSPGPIFFTQVRVGLNGKPFKIHKFRTMIVDAEKGTGAVWCKDKDTRITPFGKLLRKIRVDEMPQFWNILKGDMSFIGPRPERPEFVEMLKDRIPFYDERHLVKPGLSGWAQVLFSYGNSVEDATEKLHYDLFYIRNMTLFMDIKIALKTIATVLGGKGGL